MTFSALLGAEPTWMRNTVLINGRVRESSGGLAAAGASPTEIGSAAPVCSWQPNPNASNAIAAHARSGAFDTAPLS